MVNRPYARICLQPSHAAENFSSCPRLSCGPTSEPAPSSRGDPLAPGATQHRPEACFSQSRRDLVAWSASGAGVGTHPPTSLAVTRSSSLARGHDSPAAGTPHPTPRGKRLGTVPARGQQPATMHSFAGCKPAVRASPSSGSSRRSRRRAAARSSPGRLYLVTADRAAGTSRPRH